VVASEPTAQAAWAEMMRIHRDIGISLHEARDLHRLMAERFAGNSFLNDDAKSIARAIEQMNGVLIESRQFRNDINHLSVLFRGRAALVRRTADVPQTGDLR
jgi:hypothetical protein